MAADDALAVGRHHATVVARDGRGRAGGLILGAAGSGKSDLALRLIDRGWRLVADDQVMLAVENGGVVASPPVSLAGRLAVPGLGIIGIDHVARAAVTAVVLLSSDPPRHPLDTGKRTVCGLALPQIRIDGLAASAAIRVERFLDGIVAEGWAS